MTADEVTSATKTRTMHHLSQRRNERNPGSSRRRRPRGGAPRRTGFTLLEMMIAMFILSLLIGSVFSIVRSVTQLASSMSAEQLRDARTHGFTELCSRTFRSLPPGALVRLRTKQTGSRYLSQLVLVGAVSPVSGDAGGATVLETEEAPDGYLRVVMRSMALDQMVAWEKGDSSAGVRVPLLQDVATLDWKFFNPDIGEWEPLWNDKVDLQSFMTVGPGGEPGAPPAGIPSRRPMLIELKLAFGNEQPVRHVFWVPPAEPVNPAGTTPGPGNPPAGTPPPPQNPPPPPQ